MASLYTIHMKKSRTYATHVIDTIKKNETKKKNETYTMSVSRLIVQGN